MPSQDLWQRSAFRNSSRAWLDQDLQKPVLAVLVNVIELVCTAGLPALYTQVLVQQRVSTGERYAYLALYNLAYMLDDSIMVGIAVITLGKRKLQERAGRWLKLLSGVVILLLGALLIFAPRVLLW